MSKADEFREKMRVTARIKKLLALADDQPDTPEGKAARQKALQLATDNGIPVTGLPFVPVKQVPAPPNAGAFGAFASAFSKQFPGKDDEDYTKYGKD